MGGVSSQEKGDFKVRSFALDFHDQGADGQLRVCGAAQEITFRSRKAGVKGSDKRVSSSHTMSATVKLADEIEGSSSTVIGCGVVSQPMMSFRKEV